MISRQLSTKILFSAFLFSNNVHALKMPWSKNEEETLYAENLDKNGEPLFQDMPNVIPAQIKELVERINDLNPQQEIKDNFQNRAILHGPPGNGKTSYAEKVAEATNSFFLPYKATGLVTKFVGSGPAAIDAIFKEAFEKLENNKWEDEHRKVIIFIDEIDAIAFDDQDKLNDNTLKHLWQCLDQIQKNPNIFVIFATNKYEKLSDAFKDRFDESNVICIKRPNKMVREEVIKYYIEKIKMEVPHLNHPIKVKLLVKETSDLSIRAIKNMIYEIKRKQTEMKLVANLAACYRKKNSDTKEEKKGNNWNTAQSILQVTYQVTVIFVQIAEFSMKLYDALQNPESGASKLVKYLSEKKEKSK